MGGTPVRRHTLAEVIRDRQEAGRIVGRVDRARPDKLLAGRDPFAGKP
ncbi:hypothetical protein [Streptomyces sp. NPDC001056]